MRLAYSQFQRLVLLPAVSDFKIQEPPVIFKLLFLLRQLVNDFLLFITLNPDFDAVSPALPYLLLKRIKFGLLLRFEFLLICLLLK